MPKFVEVDIKNMIVPLEKSERDFFMVDLILDKKQISTGEEPISSHSFWTDMRNASNRALHRIEKNNPTMNFSFSLATLGQSKEQKEANFRKFAKSKHPELDVDKILDIVKVEVDGIKATGPDDNHPNPDLMMKPSDDLMRMLILKVIESMNK